MSRQQIDTIVSNITSHHSTKDLLHAHGLNSTSVTWEDTGRSKGSCWGPNISDMTLVLKDGARLMPVIRKPNFSDVTYDTPIDSFRLLVGNEKAGTKNKIISLKDYLSNLSTYCPDARSNVNLYNKRDSVILTSTQCCILPVEKGKKTEFAVQLFNYQSYNDNPAVLVILVSKNGTSTQILQTSNQKLFFNDKGTARYFDVERLEDVRERRGEAKTRVDSFKEMNKEEKLDNTIMMIQVPLVAKERPDHFGMARTVNCSDTPLKKKGRGMDMGQLGLGSESGAFVGTKGLELIRDTRFPIRCTFQYYRVTDEDYISEKNIVDIAAQLSQVANVSVASGSLVIGDKTDRKTESDLDQPNVTDFHFGKLDQRDYLQQLHKEATVTWENQTMGTF
jgi:hypothetical protein